MLAPKLKYFFNKTSLHGFKYLTAADGPNWKKYFTRFFWTWFIGASIALMCLILFPTFNNFGSKATSINLDTNYRDWDNVFPAVSICMTKGRSTKKIEEYMKAYWAATNQTLKLSVRYYRSIQSLMIVNLQNPMDGINKETCASINSSCGVNLEVIKRDLLPQKCSDFMTKVTYLGEEIDCEKIFKLYQTDIGDCFTANSLYSSSTLTSFQQLPLKHSNLDIVERSLIVNYDDIDFVIYKLYAHSPEELPNGVLESHNLRKTNAITYLALKTTEIINRHDVIDESIQARQCRFPIEYLNQHKLPYSISNFHFHQRVTRQLKDCNCTLPVGEVAEQIPRCDISDYDCCAESTAKFLANADSRTKDCITPSCLAMEISNIGLMETETEALQSVLKVDILNNPTLRYIRRVSLSKLDIIGE